MAFISAKTILSTINILDDEEVSSKKRHPKNEFQAFAYKLSKDLNDDKNLVIYMRLAKTVDRFLMERAYSFAVDSNSDQKGRLFLWKLKQLRSDVQKERNKKNFTYDFVMQQTAKFRDGIADQILSKSNSWQSEEFYEEIINIASFRAKSQSASYKVLSIGPNPDEFFLLNRVKLSAIEISRKIAKILKERKRKEKIICKDFFKNSYTEKCFDLILINSYWQFIPLDSELKLLSQAQKIMQNNGRIIINLKESLEDSQEWKGMIISNQEREYFIKNETNHTFRTTLEKCNLEIEKEMMSGPYIVYFLRNRDTYPINRESN